MFSTDQLNFIKSSLTAQNAAIPCGDGGKAARLFISVLDEIDSLLREQEFRAAIPQAKIANSDPPV